MVPKRFIWKKFLLGLFLIINKITYKSMHFFTEQKLNVLGFRFLDNHGTVRIVFAWPLILLNFVTRERVCILVLLPRFVSAKRISLLWDSTFQTG